MAWIKKIYLYAVSLISLIILVVAAIMLINMALKAWIFTKADDAYYYPVKPYCAVTTNADGSTIEPTDPACTDPNYEQKMMEEERNRRSAQRQQNASQAIAMILVATPVFLYHWNLARKEN